MYTCNISITGGRHWVYWGRIQQQTSCIFSFGVHQLEKQIESRNSHVGHTRKYSQPWYLISATTIIILSKIAGQVLLFGLFLGGKGVGCHGWNGHRLLLRLCSRLWEFHLLEGRGKTGERQGLKAANKLWWKFIKFSWWFFTTHLHNKYALSQIGSWKLLVARQDWQTSSNTKQTT